MRKLLFISLLFIIGCTGTDITPNDTGTTNTTTTTTQTGVFSTDMLTAVNALRVKGCTCGGQQMPSVPTLKWNTKLEAAAARHAKDMAINKFFDHTGSDGSTMQKRIEDAGYQWLALSENIAYGYKVMPDAITGWVNSAGHCKNMMAANVTEMGAAKNGDYWVQDFGKPR